MIKEAITNIVSGNSLTIEEASSVMEEIMSGKATQAQLGAFLVALRLKGETPEEMAGLARVMRDKARKVTVPGTIVDTAGTGGDGLNTFNISTAAAFVIAGAGFKVAKHGNRAASSRCGSADVMEALGTRIMLTPEQVRECVEQVGIGFMFAPAFHPAMEYAASPRKEIGIRTVFNILGPLTNPAGSQHQVIGVPDPGLGDKIALALCYLHTGHALIVHGLNGIDELSISGKSMLWEIRDGKQTLSRHLVEPEDLGVQRAPLEAVKGGTPQENAAILRSVLEGEKSARRDVVLLNAAAGIYVGNGNITLQQAVRLAAESIDTGSALAKLDELIAFCHNLK